jgi:hypothetical protein
MYGRDRKVIQNFNLKPIKEDNFGDLDVEVNTKVDLKEAGSDAVDWIHLAQDRDQWRAVGNTEMNLRIP